MPIQYIYIYIYIDSLFRGLSRLRGSGDALKDLETRRREEATIRVTNLSEDAKEEDLAELFGTIGKLERVFLAKHKSVLHIYLYIFIYVFVYLYLCIYVCFYMGRVFLAKLQSAIYSIYNIYVFIYLYISLTVYKYIYIYIYMYIYIYICF